MPLNRGLHCIFPVPALPRPTDVHFWEASKLLRISFISNPRLDEEMVINVTPCEQVSRQP